MCKFMSCISDGHGDVKFFTIQNIVEIMSEGNTKDYSWNSHTSMCQFFGIKSTEEDKWNKWEYNPETKELTVDSLVTTDDRKSVIHYLDKYFHGKNIQYLRNLYNNNSGSWNSGSWNSGERNSGDRNSGDRNSGSLNSGSGNSGFGNSGERNSGDRNSGDRNSGDRNSGSGNSGSWNSGSWNSGSWNSGSWNSGSWNSGERNSGDRNSGDRNSGDRNSGSGNSGDRNSGSWNSGDGVLNSLCTTRQYIIFDKPCTKEQWEESLNLPWSWFEIETWVSGGDMTNEEKEKHTYWETTNGYLKTIPYKEAWKNCPKEFITKVKKLANFDARKFENITGLWDI